MSEIGRNTPCPCGSGKKHKHCCGLRLANNGEANLRAAITPLLQQAVQLHRSGDIKAAAPLYQRVLQLDPNHPDALNLLGVVAAQTGQFEQSARLIERALAINPSNPQFHNNLGNTWLHLDESAQRSIACYRQAVHLDPTYAEAHNNLGNALKRAGELTEAERCYHAALRLNPNLFEASLGLGAALQKQGRHQEASALFRQLVERRTDNVDAHVGLGAALCSLRQLEAAEATLLQALRLDRNSASAYYNLGLVLSAQNRHHPAAESLSTAIKLQPNNPQAYYHLGLALMAGNLNEPGAEAMRQSLARDPDNPLALLGLAQALTALGRTDEALETCNQLSRRHPQLGTAHTQRGNILAQQGDHEGALQAYRDALALGDDNPALDHLIAALEGNSLPPRASDGYIAAVFDDYAPRFEQHLVDGLKYDAPQLLFDLTQVHGSAHQSNRSVLDLGCGTGLCGAAFAAQCGALVGVDLSAGMLDKARARGIYQRLVHGELLETMRGETERSYDLILSADVFVYIGDLAEIHAQAHRLLTPGGLFVYSTESADALTGTDVPATDYRLLTTGRYAHSASYLRRLAGEAGLHLLALEPRILRMERNEPIHGWCAALTRR